MLAQFNENKLIEMFIDVDDFCNCYKEWEAQSGQKLTSKWTSALSRSEAITILIYYHHSGYKCFQYYYERLVLSTWPSYFPHLVSYKHFLSLIPKCLDLMFVFTHWQNSHSNPTGIYYVDSKRLPVCHNKRIKSNRVFKDVAARGKSSMGWFYGLKIHLVINNLGQIVSFLFTPANFSDNNKKVLRELLSGLKGFCYGDKGYLTKLFEEFFTNGLRIITKVRQNMKNQLIPIQRKYELMKRGIIESVNDILMTVCDIEHTRHRSPVNAMVHMIGALIGYNYLENKPTVIIRNLNQG